MIDYISLKLVVYILQQPQCNFYWMKVYIHIYCIFLPTKMTKMLFIYSCYITDCKFLYHFICPALHCDRTRSFSCPSNVQQSLQCTELYKTTARDYVTSLWSRNTIAQDRIIMYCRGGVEERRK